MMKNEQRNTHEKLHGVLDSNIILFEEVGGKRLAQSRMIPPQPLQFCGRSVQTAVGSLSSVLQICNKMKCNMGKFFRCFLLVLRFFVPALGLWSLPRIVTYWNTSYRCTIESIDPSRRAPCVFHLDLGMRMPNRAHPIARLRTVKSIDEFLHFFVCRPLRTLLPPSSANRQKTLRT